MPDPGDVFLFLKVRQVFALAVVFRVGQPCRCSGHSAANTICVCPQENDIGLEHALYYIAYATYLEFRSNFAKADSVYQQGINRLANPVDRLKAKFQEFQHRMVSGLGGARCRLRLRGGSNSTEL